MVLIFPNFMNFDRFGENQYLKNFPLRVHLGNLITARKFFPNSFAKINREISHLNSYLLDFITGSFPIIKDSVHLPKKIPVKFGKSLWEVLVFLFKIFGHVIKSEKLLNTLLKIIEQKKLPHHPFFYRLWICLCW